MNGGFPDGSADKEKNLQCRRLDLISGLGRSPGEGKGHSLQYSGFENFMDCIVPGVTKSRARLSDFHFHHEWMLNFIKCFSFLSWDDHVVSVFSFVDVVYNIDWFACAEPSLWSWDESKLVMMYDFFLCTVGFGLLISCWEFFAYIFIKDFGLWVLGIFLVLFWYQISCLGHWMLPVPRYLLPSLALGSFHS